MEAIVAVSPLSRVTGFALALALLPAAVPVSGAVIEYEEVVCPVSKHGFFGMKVSGVNTLKHRDGDFLLRVEGGNHYATRVWACPYCFFSAYPEVFAEEKHIDFDPGSIERIDLTWEAQESQEVQTKIPVRVKYRNAAAYYYSIGKPPYFMGVLNLQGSWATRLTKNSLPPSLVATWHRLYLPIIRQDDPRSEEEILDAMAGDLRAEVKSAKSPAKRQELTFLLASALRQSGRHREAVPLLEDLVSNASSRKLSSAAAEELELARSEAQFQDEALRYFKEAVKLKETLPEDRLQSIYLVGELSRRLGKFKQAGEWFEKASKTPMPQRWARELLERQKGKLAEELAAR